MLRGYDLELLKLFFICFKIFFLKTIRPEKLKFVGKHPHIVKIQVCSNHGAGGRMGHDGEVKFYIEICRENL